MTERPVSKVKPPSHVTFTSLPNITSLESTVACDMELMSGQKMAAIKYHIMSPKLIIKYFKKLYCSTQLFNCNMLYIKTLHVTAFLWDFLHNYLHYQLYEYLVNLLYNNQVTIRVTVSHYVRSALLFIYA